LIVFHQYPEDHRQRRPLHAPHPSAVCASH
jgi:hypothetical protein